MWISPAPLVDGVSPLCVVNDLGTSPVITNPKFFGISLSVQRIALGFPFVFSKTPCSDVADHITFLVVESVINTNLCQGRFPLG